MQSNTLISQSPSFDTYSSSSRLALIAARVVHEFQPHSNFDDYLFHNQTNPRLHQSDKEELRTIDDVFEDDDEEFEFASVSREPDLSSDQFEFGQIRPVYPLFDTKLVFDSNRDVEIDRNLSAPTVKSPVRLPLRKLFSEERERDLPSCSSSDADELDRVPAEMYCVWKPKPPEKLPESCKKSSSTGSSKRWKFKDLLFRSNSEGKDTFIFLKKTTSKNEKISGKVNAVSGEVPPMSYMEKVKDNDRRRTSVAYNKDIVGMFANVNEVSRNLHPF